ncbi:MAG: LacI family DNA-binding transcriptional regulator [Bulleidia sp.]
MLFMGKMTIQDIAGKANVSKSTVSRYLNGGSIGQETQEKIRRIIKKYDYRPNAFARLNAKQSGMIGVVVPTLNSRITSRAVSGKCGVRVHYHGERRSI